MDFNPASNMGATVKQAFFELGERPTFTERITYGAPTTGEFLVVPHERLLTGLRRESGNNDIQWQAGRPRGLSRETTSSVLESQVAGRYVCSGSSHLMPVADPSYSGTAFSVSTDVLNTIQTNLMSLKSFLDQNPSLFHGVPLDASSSRSGANIPDQQAIKVNFIAHACMQLS